MYKKSILLVVVIILSMFFLTTCKKDNPTEPTLAPLIITVGEGLQPNYYWTEANGDSTGVCKLEVFRITNLGDAIWGIETITQGGWSFETSWYEDGISSPVTHGVVQEGSEKSCIADIWPLPAGLTYRVKMTKMNGQQGNLDFSR